MKSGYSMQLFYNGKILTMASSKIEAVEPEAVVLSENEIIFVGSLEEWKEIGAEAEMIDLKGQTLIPGFIDTLQSDGEGPGGEATKMEAMAMQFLNTEIPQSLYCIIIGKTLEGINAITQSPLNDRKRNVTRSFKIFADGTFGSCTACMSEPRT